MLSEVRNLLQYEAEQVLGDHARAIVRESAGIWWTCQIVGHVAGEEVDELLFADSLTHLMYVTEQRLARLEKIAHAA